MRFCSVSQYSIPLTDLPKVAARTSGHFRKLWAKESREFHLIDVIAHHFKHVLSDDERNKGNRPGIPIGMALGFNDTGETMDLRNLYFIIRDAVRFVHRKAETEHPALPAPHRTSRRNSSAGRRFEGAGPACLFGRSRTPLIGMGAVDPGLMASRLRGFEGASCWTKMARVTRAISHQKLRSPNLAFSAVVPPERATPQRSPPVTCSVSPVM